MRSRLAALTIALLALAGCCGHEVYQVWVRNETDSAYTLMLLIDGEEAYPSEVRPSAEGFANAPGAGAHPDGYVLYDAACQVVVSGDIGSDDVQLVIRSEGVEVVEHAPPGNHENLPSSDGCI